MIFDSIRRLLPKGLSNKVIAMLCLVIHMMVLGCCVWLLIPVWSLLSVYLIGMVIVLWVSVLFLLFIFFINSIEVKEQADWQALAELDQLTKIRNRRGLLNAMTGKCWDTFYSVVIIDIDDFKNINDTYGHGVGDEVLCYLASLLDGMVRYSDIVCRWGGDEFVVILHNTDYGGANVFIQRVHSELLQRRDCKNAFMQSSLPLITISAGAAQHKEGSELSEIITKADIKLFRAKKGGFVPDRPL